MLLTQKRQGNCSSIIFGILLYLLAFAAQAKDVIEHRDNGSINWTTGEINATGYGVEPTKYKDTGRGQLLARRAAIVDGYRNLAEITHGVRVTSNATVKGLIEQNRITKTQVSGVIKGAEIIDDNFEAGIASVNMRLKMGAKFMSTIMSKQRFRELISKQNSSSMQFLPVLFGSIIPTAHAAVLPESIDINSDQHLQWAQQMKQWLNDYKGADMTPLLDDAIQRYQQATAYTGVVIDARDVPELEWATHVKLVNTDGETLYPNLQTDYAVITRNRLTSFDYDLDSALKKVRVASQPLLLKAKHVYRKRTSDLVLAKADAERLMQLSNSSASDLNHGRVIIVVAE